MGETLARLLPLAAMTFMEAGDMDTTLVGEALEVVVIGEAMAAEAMGEVGDTVRIAVDMEAVDIKETGA